jgi:outer membrane lipopolysaccharide assembly protein LptE/RlpB
VYYRVIYSLDSGTGQLLSPREQTLTQDYTYDETLVLGKAREEEVLRDTIASDLVRIVLIQLSSLTRNGA